MNNSIAKFKIDLSELFSEIQKHHNLNDTEDFSKFFTQSSYDVFEHSQDVISINELMVFEKEYPALLSQMFPNIWKLAAFLKLQKEKQSLSRQIEETKTSTMTLSEQQHYILSPIYNGLILTSVIFFVVILFFMFKSIGIEKELSDLGISITPEIYNHMQIKLEQYKELSNFFIFSSLASFFSIPIVFAFSSLLVNPITKFFSFFQKRQLHIQGNTVEQQNHNKEIEKKNEIINQKIDSINEQLIKLQNNQSTKEFFLSSFINTNIDFQYRIRLALINLPENISLAKIQEILLSANTLNSLMLEKK